MELKDIIYYSIIGSILLILIIYYGIKAIKNHWVKELAETITSACKEAENLYTESGKGKEKKAYVLGKVEGKCKEIGIPYTLIKTLIDKFIEGLVQGYNTFKK